MAIQYNANMMNLPTPQPMYIGPSFSSGSGSGFDLLGTVGSIGGSLVNMIGGAIQNRRNRKFQEKMLKKQMAFTTSEREAMQEYNTSERLAAQEWNSEGAQLQRMMEAGINPNNAAANINGSNIAPQSSSEGSAPSPVSDPAMNNISSLLNPELMNLDLVRKKAEADVELTQKQAGVADSEKFLNQERCKEVNANWKKSLFELHELMPKTKEQLEKIIDNLTKEGILTQKKVDEVNAIIDNYAKQMEAIDENIRVQEETIKKIKAETQTEFAQQTLDYANADLANAEASLARSKKERQDLQNKLERDLQSQNESLDYSSDKFSRISQALAVKTAREIATDLNIGDPVVQSKVEQNAIALAKKGMSKLEIENELRAKYRHLGKKVQNEWNYTGSHWNP